FFASVIVFGILVFFHELGHFMVAKLVGIKVREFSLGFGPKLVSISKGETAYNLRAFPLGGFVSMAGMDPGEESPDDEERGFNSKTVGERIAVIIAGPMMNFILASILLAIIFMSYGVPDKPSNTVQGTLAGKPAELAGIKPGDTITAINGIKVISWDQLSETVGRNPDKALNITIERGSEKLSLSVVPYRDEKNIGKIGIMPAPTKVGPVRAMVSGVKYTGLLSYQIIDYLGKGIAQKVPLELGGPVQIVATINEAVESSNWLLNLVSLAAFLSISLGLFNLFPIPALDGSRIIFLLIEKLRGKAVEQSKENFIHMVGFALLLLLIVFITYNDVLHLVM
ncbi:MAG: RIP metalloprotease RseP, partial [Peptococcaceae bacterium]|nr:RIP metalloprotease RseP [Peptococcaceae bacterium]